MKDSESDITEINEIDWSNPWRVTSLLKSFTLYLLTLKSCLFHLYSSCTVVPGGRRKSIEVIKFGLSALFN